MRPTSRHRKLCQILTRIDQMLAEVKEVSGLPMTRKERKRLKHARAQLRRSKFEAEMMLGEST
jgi:hypothetical protein